MAFVVFTVNGPSERSEARGKITNEEIAELAHKLDDVAVDFPDMPIVIAHPSFPWQEEALSVATHKPQVYIDLSGWSS
jgi:predicted TIM-barrel fold metal-dependent hydrolase